MSAAPTAKLSVHLTPRAFANAVGRYEDGVIHLRLTAPPVEGTANAACCVSVAALLGLRPSQITVSHGYKSRDHVAFHYNAADDSRAQELQTRRQKDKEFFNGLQLQIVVR